MSDTPKADADFLASVLAATAAEGHGTLHTDPSPAQSRDARALRTVERMIETLLGRILDDPGFVALEARWRALHRLVGTAAEHGAAIAVAPASKAEIMRDLQRAPSLDHTMPWRTLVDGGLDPAAPRPFAALLIDAEWDSGADDVDSLHLLGGIGAAAHCAVLTNVAPGLLGLSDWDTLPPPGELARRVGTASHARWRGFRDSEEGRFVALGMPRLRLPLREGRDASIGAAWLLAEAVTAGFAGTGLGLPASDWRAAGLAVPGEAEPRVLAELGIAAAMPATPTDATVPLRPMAQRPKRYDREAATRHAAARAQLDHVLSISRFAQALTVLGLRERRAGHSPEAVRAALAAWLAPFLQGPGAALAEARVDIQPGRGSDGPALIAWLAPGPRGDGASAEPVVLDVL